MHESVVGSQIGNYRIVDELGVGAMGSVYLAEHVVMGKRAAMKLIREELAHNPGIIARFLNEAKAINAAGHPNIVEVSDAGTADGKHFILMELLSGQTLEDRLEKNAALPIETARHVALQICDALATAHERGIVHRDIKPANIFLINRDGDDAFVKLLDFGVVKFIQPGPDAAAGLTAHGMLVGTPQYMSPEQAIGADELDHRSDIYSLGMVLYHMVTGRLPFNVPSHHFMRYIMAHTNDVPIPPSKFREDIPPALEKVLLRTLAKEPGDRYADMRALKLALAPTEDISHNISANAAELSASLAADVAPNANNPRAAAAALMRLVLDSVSAGRIQLPSMPAAAIQCLQLLRSPDHKVSELVAILGRDPIVAPQVIAGANSAIYGGSGRVRTIEQAVMRLGSRSLNTLLVELSTRKLFESRSADIRKMFKTLWDHSVGVAIVARELAKLTRADLDLTYLAGLLHDVGKPVSAAILLEAERVAVKGQRTWHAPDAWLELISQCHRDVGFTVARAWQLPDEVLMAIARSDRYSLDGAPSPVNLVCLANALVKRHGIRNKEIDLAEINSLIADGMSLFNLRDKDIEMVVAQLEQLAPPQEASEVDSKRPLQRA